MITTCPNCHTEFNIPDAAYRPGRKARCAVCAQVFVLPDVAGAAPQGVPAAQTPQVAQGGQTGQAGITVQSGQTGQTGQAGITVQSGQTGQGGQAGITAQSGQGGTVLQQAGQPAPAKQPVPPEDDDLAPMGADFDKFLRSNPPPAQAPAQAGGNEHAAAAVEPDTEVAGQGANFAADLAAASAGLTDAETVTDSGAVPAKDEPKDFSDSELDAVLVATALNKARSMSGATGNNAPSDVQNNAAMYGAQNNDAMYGAQNNDAMYGAQNNAAKSGVSDDEVRQSGQRFDSGHAGQGRDAAATESRGSSGPGKKIFLLLAVLVCLGGIGFGGWYIFQAFNPSEPDGTTEAISMDPAALEKVRHLDVQSNGIKYDYIVNEKLGKILVLEGKVTNNFTTPKDNIVVEARLLDSRGVVLKSQRQVCGVLLSPLQLTALGQQELFKALNNRIEIMANNVNVTPGASVPYMVVFIYPPDDTVEFEVSAVDVSDPPAIEAE